MATTREYYCTMTRTLLKLSSQRKFKKAVETTGFQLVNGAVVAAGSGMPKATPKKPRTSAKKTPESTLKKRKLGEIEEAEVGGVEATKDVVDADGA